LRLQTQKLEAEKAATLAEQAAVLAERLKSEHSAAASEAMKGDERVRDLKQEQQRAIDSLRVIGKAERHARLPRVHCLKRRFTCCVSARCTTLMFGACDALTRANACPAAAS
jgi:hypothetical protein